MKKTLEKEITRRVVALLNKDQIEFLNRLSVDAFFSTGRRLTKVDIVSALVDAAMQLEISGIGIKSREELIEKIISEIQTFSERREYPRVKKTFQVNFRPVESLQSYEASKAENVSLGGICFTVASINSPQVNQVLEIILTDEKNNSVKSIGRVAWVNQEDLKQQVKVGVKLTHINQSDWETFKQYLDE